MPCCFICTRRTRAQTPQYEDHCTNTRKNLVHFAKKSPRNLRNLNKKNLKSQKNPDNLGNLTKKNLGDLHKISEKSG